MAKYKYFEYKHRKLFNKLNSINISYEALKSYRSEVKGNKRKPEELLKKKLKRNFLVGITTYADKEHMIREYGSLKITLRKNDNEIIKVENNKGLKGCYISSKKKEVINKLLGIKE